MPCTVTFTRLIAVLIALGAATISFGEKEVFELENGQSVKGELIGVYGGSVFIDTGKKGIRYCSYYSLTESSRVSSTKWFEEYLASVNEASPKMSEVDTKFANFLSDNLVRLEGGELVDYDFGEEEQPEFFMFYYSAHWCGPCRRFTPKLVAFYNVMKKMGHDFELIFVSSDEGPKAMKKYMTEAKMPWPAVNFKKTGNRLVDGYSGSGIPCLVVTDRNGKTLFHSYSGGEYLGPSDPMKKAEKLMFRMKSLKEKVRDEDSGEAS